MRILWICNIMLPVAARYTGRTVSNREGWLTGLAEALKGQPDLELAAAFPVDRELDGFKEVLEEITCYGFYENLEKSETYDSELEQRLDRILHDFHPDVVHCFGTEYPHTLAVMKLWDKNRILIGIQGVCGAIAKAYLSDLPESVVKRVTLRDFLRQDSVLQQVEKFQKRAIQEREALQQAKHVTGRTLLDRAYALESQPEVCYYTMNETLRPEFYEGIWSGKTCEPYRIFVSQGDYPLKGLHYVLHALPEILMKYPKAKVYVAGNSIVNWETWKDRLKISSYGKYLRELLKLYGLRNKVEFLGKLNASEMKEAYLKSHLFVCASSMENSPNSLGEAMLLGVPCVAAAVGGVPDIFVQGKDGLTYPGYGAIEYQNSENPQMAQAHRLADTVIRMWENEEKMMEYAAQARFHARVTHDGQKNCQRLLEIYHELSGE